MIKPSGRMGRRAHLPADVALVQRPAEDMPIVETPREANARRLWALTKDVRELQNEVKALRMAIEELMRAVRNGA